MSKVWCANALNRDFRDGSRSAHDDGQAALAAVPPRNLDELRRNSHTSPALSMAPSRLRRRRLRRRQAARRVGGQRFGDAGNHQTFRSGERLRNSAAPLGRRKNLCMARQMSPPRQGLRSLDHQRRRVGARRPHPRNHPTHRKELIENEIISSPTLRS